MNKNSNEYKIDLILEDLIKYCKESYVTDNILQKKILNLENMSNNKQLRFYQYKFNFFSELIELGKKIDVDIENLYKSEDLNTLNFCNENHINYMKDGMLEYKGSLTPFFWDMSDEQYRNYYNLMVDTRDEFLKKYPQITRLL